MNIPWRAIIWQQFGAAIDDLGNTIDACPDDLWRARLWEHSTEQPEFSEFWYIAYHTLFWLDLYLTGAEEGFVPRAPFTLIEQDEDGPVPERPFTKQELHAYLLDCRRKCQETIEGMTVEAAERRCLFGWGEVSFAELLLYTMRHVQGHAAQLNLLLGQKSVTVRSWVLRAGERE
jgi:DinB family protein